MLSLEIVENILYIGGLPAFPVCNHLCKDEEKDWIAPDTATMYMNNKEFVDQWLKNQKRFAENRC